MSYRFHYRGWREIGLETSRRIKELFAELRGETLQELVRRSCEWRREAPARKGSMWFYIHHVYVRELKEYLYMGDEGIKALEEELRKKRERMALSDVMEPYLPKASENVDGIAIDGLSCTGQDIMRAYGRSIR